MRSDGFAHFGLTVTSIERTAEFYSSHFGFEVPREVFEYETPWIGKLVGHDGARVRLGFLAIADVLIELHQYRCPEGHERVVPDTTYVGCPHIAIRVEDVEATYHRLLDEGVEFISPPQAITDGAFAGYVCAYCRDPDGLIVEITQPPAAAAQAGLELTMPGVAGLRAPPE
ncbi:MAG: VOC family protein [Solirubrobacterales bacterium]|nr:VOC family protein [Solirubrobacterales bacterium]